MIPALFAILACQLTGEAISRLIGLPVPGPVIGFALLLIGLILSEPLRRKIRPVAETVLGNLMLLFVPAGVGAALLLPGLGSAALPLLLAVLVSTLLAITAGALAFTFALRLTQRGPGRQ